MVVRRAEPAVIRYAVAETAVGTLLLAATPAGVRALVLGDGADPLEAWLRTECPGAERADAQLAGWVGPIVRFLAGDGPAPALPLDAGGTAFQQRVWAELRRIPAGETRTYTQVAAALGSPAAVRAVARACATNPVSVLTPCHRVIGADGGLRGYRWGLDRKRLLLERERV